MTPSFDAIGKNAVTFDKSLNFALKLNTNMNWHSIAVYLYLQSMKGPAFDSVRMPSRQSYGRILLKFILIFCFNISS